MADTEHKHTLEATVISQMDTQANYVEQIAQNNAEIILSSGFELANQTHSPWVLRIYPAFASIINFLKENSKQVGTDHHTRLVCLNHNRGRILCAVCARCERNEQWQVKPQVLCYNGDN